MAKGKGKSRRIRSADGEMNRYLNDLGKKGYLVEMGAKGHWKIYLLCDQPEKHQGWHCKSCRFVTGTSASPSSKYSLRNLQRQMEEGMQRIREQKPA